MLGRTNEEDAVGLYNEKPNLPRESREPSAGSPRVSARHRKAVLVRPILTYLRKGSLILTNNTLPIYAAMPPEYNSPAKRTTRYITCNSMRRINPSAHPSSAKALPSRPAASKV